MRRIFVSVASFVDPMLFFTVCRLLHRADHPDRLHLSILDQSPHSQEAIYGKDPRITYQHVMPWQSQGACWARAKVQEAYRGEDLYLQIDSHTDLVEGWDSLLEQDLEVLLKRYDKPLLTTYPPGFEVKPDGLIERAAPEGDGSSCLTLAPKNEETLSPNTPVLMFEGNWVKSRWELPGFHVAGGFIFTLGKFVEEVPYDPELYFHGEEQSLALRAFSRGWCIFHPVYNRVFHLYKTAGRESESLHWSKTWEERRTVKWPVLSARAKERLKALFEGRLDGTIFGLGNERSLEDFKNFSGVDYQTYQVAPARWRWLKS